MANCMGVPLHTQNIFHIHLCDNLHIVSQHPHDPATQMLPHGKCVELLSDHAIFLPHLKTFMPHHSEASHTWPPKTFSALSLCSHFPLSLAMVNLLLLCNLNFTSSTLLSWLSFSYQTGMQVFYVTPALVFWFVVVSSVFQLFSSLDRFSLIPTTSTNFRHHLQAWIHSTLVTQVPEPFPITLEVLHIMGFTQNTLSSFIKIAVG